MAKTRSKALSRLRGKTKITPSGRKVVSLGASKKAYSKHEKTKGPVAEIENAPHGSKGDAVKRWWQNVQDKKLADKLAKGKVKRLDKKSVGDAETFKQDYIKKQDKIISTSNKIKQKRPNDSRIQEMMDNKIYNATLRKRSAQKDGFGDLNKRQITAFRKEGFTKSPQQLKDGFNSTQKLPATTDNRTLRKVADKVFSDQLDNPHISKYKGKGVGFQTSHFNDKKKIINNVFTKGTNGNAFHSKHGDLGVSYDAFKLGIQTGKIARPLSPFNTGSHASELMFAYGFNKKGYAAYTRRQTKIRKLAGQRDERYTGHIKNPKPIVDKFTPYESQFDQGPKRVAPKRGNTKTRLRIADAYQNVVTKGGSVFNAPKKSTPKSKIKEIKNRIRRNKG